ncbi:Butyrophilin subfamily 1 member A1 [Collichthys lucidus]|uniref:Butyrophilin subfamily 1 member A1 n=1 Tax=Collichthys lucidus TaxID=240159 RepID=A0A4V6ATS0_COLLU|nr:Butyrophilin subfamily 1 member A1 [Collichthys lucidus]
MCCGCLLVAALLSCCAGESLVDGPPEKVLAFAGGDVILPCSYNITDNNDFPTVEWSKEGLQPSVVFLYRDGCETHEMKNPAFEYRTSFINKELQNGNISLRISNVQLSDAGKYKCKRLWKNAPWDITTVELVVGVVSEPKLSVVSAESGGVTLQCEAKCGLPELEVTFLDDRGNIIPADDARLHGTTVTRRVALQDATNSVTCRAHHPKIKQTRNTEILIPVDCMRPCFLPIVIAVGVTIVLAGIACGIAVFVWKTSAVGQKLPLTRVSSDQSTKSSVSLNQPLLNHRPEDNKGKSKIGEMKKQVANLQSKLCEKEKIIQQLQNSKPQLSPVVCHLDKPTICRPAASTHCKLPKSGSLPQNQAPKQGISRQNSSPAPGRVIQKSHRNHSCPALNFNAAVASSSSLANAAKKNPENLTRSLSMTSARPGPKVSKTQRRSSVVLTPSGLLSSNRFGPLAEEDED